MFQTVNVCVFALLCQMNTHSFLYEKGGYKQPNSHFTSMFQFVPVYFSTFVLNFQADFLFNNEFDSFKRQQGFKKIVAFHGLRSVHPSNLFCLSLSWGGSCYETQANIRSKSKGISHYVFDHFI